MTCGVYEIVNKVNGKRYVGSSVNIEQRWYAHKSNLRRGKHHSIHLQRAWDKHGEDLFCFNILSECDTENILEQEQLHIEIKSEYNIAPIAGRTTGVTQSEISNKRRSESCIKTLSDPTVRKKISDGVKRALERPEYRMNVSNALKAVWAKPEHREKMSKARSGKNGSRYDNTLYTFAHEDHGEVVSTQYEFREKYGIRASSLSSLISGTYKSTKGWTLKKTPN